MGGVGGLFYVLVRRWLPAPSIPRAFAFVILAFLITAGGPLDETNKDFFIFGPPILAVALFSLLYLPYGLATALLVNRFDRYVPPPFSSRDRHGCRSPANHGSHSFRRLSHGDVHQGHCLKAPIPVENSQLNKQTLRTESNTGNRSFHLLPWKETGLVNSL